MSHSAKEHTSAAGGGYEKRDVSIKWSLIVTAAIVVGVVLSIAFVDEIFVATKEDMIKQYQLVPENTMLRELRAKEAEVLSGYKLLDPQKGIYRIPIERAMQLMADEAYTVQRLNTTTK